LFSHRAKIPEDIELIDGKYIRLPHKAVTISNVDEIEVTMK
jgi:hypothetical protein